MGGMGKKQGIEDVARFHKVYEQNISLDLKS
jgi:hypothetical protein